VLQGTVLKITAKDAIVDFGYKSEGLVPIEQFLGPSGELTVQAGDVVDVMIDHGEQPEGYILLSHAKAARVRVWDNLEKAFADQLVLLGHVMGRVKGGLSVDVGIEAFMPGSQVDPRPVHHLDSFIGQDVPVKIVKVNRRRGNVVVSRKLAVEQEVNQRKAATLDQLSEGAIVTGVVKNLTEYGAFVDLGGWMACCTSRTCRMAAWGIRRKSCTWATPSQPRCSSSTGPRSASRWACGRWRRIPGKPSPSASR
jgi:small subunit ribosomal protein S1